MIFDVPNRQPVASAHVSIRDLGRIIAPRSGNRLIAVLAAYFDASKTEVSIGITSIAGYVAPLDEWARVEAEWLEAMGLWQLESFHYADLPNIVGHEKTPQCAEYFAHIIRRSQLAGIGFALLDVDWQQQDWRGDQTLREATKYDQCLAAALGILAKQLRQEFPGDSVGVVCDLDAKEQDIFDVFKKCKAQYPVLGTITAGTATNVLPLQCSDLAAGYLRKSWLKYFSPGDQSMWGEFPKGRRRVRSGFWSLRSGAIIEKALAMSERANRTQL